MQIIGEVVHLKRFVFFKTIPRRISFGAEEVAQIVVTPKVSDAEAKVIDKLNQFKKLMRDQVSRLKQFCTQDPGSRANGGFIK
jgi:hypothetical protein